MPADLQSAPFGHSGNLPCCLGPLRGLGNDRKQAVKEVRQRFDFKNTDASIAWSGEAIELEANSEERVKAVLDVFQSKLVRRGVSLKALDAGEPRSSGKL